MKTIYLLRHAKSDWDDPSLDDFDRPLSEQGKKDARLLGLFLKQIGLTSGYVAASPAVRSMETTRFCLEAAGMDFTAVHWIDELYNGTAEDYIRAVKDNAKQWDHKLLVGHNPVIEHVASALCGREGHFSITMSTGALVCLDLPADRWERVKPETARLKWMIVPKLLRTFLPGG